MCPSYGGSTVHVYVFLYKRLKSSNMFEKGSETVKILIKRRHGRIVAEPSFVSDIFFYLYQTRKMWIVYILPRRPMREKIQGHLVPTLDDT